MSTEQWDRLQVLFHAARTLPATERDVYLARECPDPELRQVVVEMVASETAEPLGIEEAFHTWTSGAGERPDALGDVSVPASVGPYRVERALGSGGMADVFLGRAEGPAAHAVAIKVLRVPVDGRPVLERFRMEREILSRLDHPRIARLLDGGKTGEGRPWLALEYVDGVPLRVHLDREAVGLPERLRLFDDVADAVAFAHGQDVLHRDLKPSNVLVTGSGRAVLVDFGIGKLLAPPKDPGLASFQTPVGVRLLTPTHAAPEQVEGAPASTATDIYGLGLILYELLAGRPAFDPMGLNWLEWERVVLEEVPPPPSQVWEQSGIPRPWGETVAVALDPIVARALAKDPEARFDSATQFRAAVAAACGP